MCWIATPLIPALGGGRGRQICEISKPACSTREFQASQDYKQNEKNPPHSPSSNGVKRGHRLLTPEVRVLWMFRKKEANVYIMVIIMETSTGTLKLIMGWELADHQTNWKPFIATAQDYGN